VVQSREESKQRRTRKRLVFGLAVVTSGVLFAGGMAMAASDTVVAGPGEAYSASTYNADQGEVVQFRDDGGDHNVTARTNGPDGGALFLSPTISGGTASVQGTQYLPAGDYAFFCTVHPTTMSGTLHITGNGTPQARPTASVKVQSRKLAKVNKKGVQVAITSSAKVDGASLVAKLGKATIGKLSGVSLSAGQSFATIKLSKSGKSKLKNKSKASVSVVATIPFGSPATGKAKLT
jgi:plastocyanin